MAIVVKKTIQSNSNYPVSKRITKISLVFAAWPQATWRQNKVLKWRGGGHSDVFPCQEMGGGGSGPRGSNAGQKSLSSHLWPSEPCAPQRGAQRGCHRWFYTCSCLAFSTLVVSVFVTQHYTVTSTSGSLTARPRFQLTSCEHIRTLDFPERIRLFFFSFTTNVCHVFFFFSAAVGRWSRARNILSA